MSPAQEKEDKKINLKRRKRRRADWEGETADTTQYERDKDSEGGRKGSGRNKYSRE